MVSWDDYYNAAKTLSKGLGMCIIPKEYVDQKTGLKLGEWAAEQRKLYREGVLPTEQTQKLGGIGFFWEVEDGVDDIPEPQPVKITLAERPAKTCAEDTQKNSTSSKTPNSDVLAECERIIKVLSGLFEPETLPETIFATITTTTTKTATTCAIYKKINGNRYNIAVPPHLMADVKACVQYILHALIHIHNDFMGVKDVSRNNFYHNAKFARAAERVGIVCMKDSTYGFAATGITSKVKALIEEHQLGTGFSEVKEEDISTKSKTKKKHYRYICCNCGNSCWGTRKEPDLFCARCYRESGELYSYISQEPNGSKEEEKQRGIKPV